MAGELSCYYLFLAETWFGCSSTSASLEHACQCTTNFSVSLFLASSTRNTSPSLVHCLSTCQSVYKTAFSIPAHHSSETQIPPPSPSTSCTLPHTYPADNPHLLSPSHPI